MDQKILDFLKKERVCALTTLLSDGTPHASAMHFFLQENPFAIYFLTENDSRKFQRLGQTGSTKAAVLVGLSEEEMVSLQMEGDLKEEKDNAKVATLKKENLVKNPHHEKFYADPNHVFICFTPTWWRFSAHKEKLVLSSDNV